MVTELQMAYLRWAAAAQAAEEKEMARVRAFYEGAQGLVLTDRQKEYLAGVADDVTKRAVCNICRRAVEIPLERLQLRQWRPVGAPGFAAAVNRWMKSNATANPMSNMPMSQYDLYERVLRDGTAVVIVGWDGRAPTFSINELWDGESGNVRLHFDDGDGRLMFASKRWVELDPLRPERVGITRQTLYFADRIERYVSRAGAGVGGWELMPSTPAQPNPQPWVTRTGEPLGIPVVPFWNPGGSELDDLLMPQVILNKSLVDIVASMDFHGFPMLVMRGRQALLGADGKPEKLPVGPGAAIDVPNPAGGIDRVPAADMTGAWNTGVMGIVLLASMMKGWPEHVWMRGQPPSGEALTIMEGSLISQVERKQEMIGESWVTVFELGRRMAATFTGEVIEGDIEAEWRDPAIVSPTAHRSRMADLLEKEQKFGVSNDEALRQLGYTEKQIAKMQAEREVAAADAADQMLTAFENRAPAGGRPVGK